MLLKRFSTSSVYAYESDKSAHKAGYRAYKYGKYEDVCPYSNHQLRLRTWWLAGYRDASREGG